MAAAAELRWDTLEQRKHEGENLYHRLYEWKMRQLPEDVRRFCDPETSAPRRKELLQLLRSLEEASSCQRLQILFSFSVPSPQVLQLLADLGLPLVSAGAGTGYWEFLLRSRGLDVVAFDQNTIFPPEMRYTEVLHIFKSMEKAVIRGELAMAVDGHQNRRSTASPTKVLQRLLVCLLVTKLRNGLHEGR